MGFFDRLFGKNKKKDTPVKVTEPTNRSSKPSSPRKPTGYKYYDALEALTIITPSDTKEEYRELASSQERLQRAVSKWEMAREISSWARNMPGRKEVYHLEKELKIGQSYREWSEGYRELRVFRVGEDKYIYTTRFNEWDKNS